MVIITRGRVIVGPKCHLNCRKKEVVGESADIGIGRGVGTPVVLMLQLRVGVV